MERGPKPESADYVVPHRPPPEGDLRAYLDTIRAEPNELAHRLVFAAWLDEHGDPRGEMVRLSIELAQEPVGTARQRDLYEQYYPRWGEAGTQFVGWVGALTEEGVSAGLDRGLLAVRVLDGVDPEEHFDPAFYAAVRLGWAGRVEFVDSGGKTFPHVARGGWPSLRSAPVITARGQTETEDIGLAGVGTLENLRELTHDDDRDREYRFLTDAGLASLQGLPKLERVQLYGRFTASGVLGLSALPELRRLELDGVAGNLAELTEEFRRRAPGCELSLRGFDGYSV
ncbi:MAG TPA: TIGR02996 domain-containing protein [Urbifossiella sp.]|nr:TIGR02996 domain-containing protein [Urbifossiella sp.]